MSLPPPTTFAEGQRKLFGLLVAAAGMFCGGVSLGMIAMLMWGHWSAREEHTILVIFGWTLGGFIACMASVIIALSVGGPVGRFKASVSKDGASFESESAAPPAVKTVTTTETTAPGGGSDGGDTGP